MLFGPNRDREFGWLPSVPQGTVTGFYIVDGVTRPVTVSDTTTTTGATSG